MNDNQKTNSDWDKNLTPEQYNVLRNKATEAPFTGKFLHNENSGIYTCAACGSELFSSEHKFDSGSGWPSFYDVAKSGSVKLVDDNSHGMRRTEVVCSKCGGHLGHLFDDAQNQPTGKRYCINSLSLGFKDANDKK
jgi:peptide-methionine (R)-S-oxide reductase